MINKRCRKCKTKFKVVNRRAFSAKFCSMACYSKSSAIKNNGKKVGKTNKGISKSIEHRQKLSTSKMAGNNPMWKGTQAGIDALHIWVAKRLKKPKCCSYCGKRRKLDLANRWPTYNKKTYTRELKNWRWLCRRCHMILDKRLVNFVNFKNNLKNLSVR